MKKSNKYLIIAFAVLLIITYFVLRRESSSYVTNEITEKFVTFDSAMVDKIEVHGKSGFVVLEKIAGTWNLTQPVNYLADEEGLLKLISDTKSAELKDLISSNPDKQKLYEVDSSGTQVAIYQQGNRKDAFYVGKAGSDYLSTYIRKVNSSDVYLINKPLSFSFNKTITNWRNKSIFKAPIASINQVKFQYGDTIFVLRKEQNSWLVDNDSSNSKSVESFLNAISGLNTSEFIDTMINLPQKPAAIVDITTANQDQLKFYHSTDKVDKYYVVNSKNPQVFMIESWTATNILKRKKDLVK
jgi:hypothetical protein